MKTNKIIITSLLFFQTILCSNELAWVDTQVDAIKPPRVGMDNSEILKIGDPFIFYKKGSLSKKATSSVKYSATSDAVVVQAPKQMILSAIINSSALINGEWYRLNQTLNGFTIAIITRTSVVLSKGDKKFVLTTSDQNRNLKFK